MLTVKKFLLNLNLRLNPHISVCDNFYNKKAECASIVSCQSCVVYTTFVGNSVLSFTASELNSLYNIEDDYICHAELLVWFQTNVMLLYSFIEPITWFSESFDLSYLQPKLMYWKRQSLPRLSVTSVKQENLTSMYWKPVRLIVINSNFLIFIIFARRKQLPLLKCSVVVKFSKAPFLFLEQQSGLGECSFPPFETACTCPCWMKLPYDTCKNSYPNGSRGWALINLWFTRPKLIK